MMKSLLPAERPRERLLNHGAQALSLRECLALLVGAGPPGLGSLGVAENLLTRSLVGESFAGEAVRGEAPAKETSEGAADAAERAFFTALETGRLAPGRGLGDSGRARILAAYELGRRYAAFRERRRREQARLGAVNVDVLQKAFAGVPERLRSEGREWLGFVPCYGPTALGAFQLVERGVRTHVNFEAADLFGRLLALRPRAFYLFHNHPSGELTPSLPDLQLTRDVRDLAEKLGLRLLGHGIVTAEGERWITI